MNPIEEAMEDDVFKDCAPSIRMPSTSTEEV